MDLTELESQEADEREVRRIMAAATRLIRAAQPELHSTAELVGKRGSLDERFGSALRLARLLESAKVDGR